MVDTLDRVRGALLGLACGDAVGTTNEFTHNPPPIHDLVGGGPFKLEPGQWTDDTSMALCLADSLIAQNGFDARDQMDRYVRWQKHGENSPTGTCFDIGITISAALRRYQRTGDPFAGDTDPNTAGNGSLMRLVPVVLYYWPNAAQAEHYAAESSRTTHAAPQAIDACRAYARRLCLALDGAAKPELLANWPPKTRAEIKPTGYVVDSLEAALFCFATTNDFREGCLLAANLGGDADTIAAIYGQLAGAHYGEQGIPEQWRQRLAWHDHIRTLAEKLYQPRRPSRSHPPR
jgi:ADP-ribosyl-[dinitrogen reductase] hydrolase